MTSTMATNDSTLFTIGSVLIFIAAPPATLFPILYAAWFPFWKNTLGRALMTKAVGVALLMDLAVAYFLFGDDYALREAARVMTYGLIAAGLWWQLWSIVKIRLEDWRCRKQPGAHSAEDLLAEDDEQTMHHGGEKPSKRL